MRIAVLGTGRMGSARAKLLRSEEVLLAGGDPARTAAVAAACGATPVTVEEALAGTPDGVVVASATDRHAEHLLAAAELGVPVLCEKPIALTVEDTRAAVEALARTGATVQVGFQRRFDPGFAAAREADVGTRYSLRITARDADPAEEHYIPGSGGIFRDMHVHDFDLARWISGREVATVYATGAVRGFERFARQYGETRAALAVAAVRGPRADEPDAAGDGTDVQTFVTEVERILRSEVDTWSQQATAPPNGGSPPSSET